MAAVPLHNFYHPYPVQSLFSTLESYPYLNQVVPGSFKIKGYEKYKYVLVVLEYEGFYMAVMGQREKVEQHIHRHCEEDIYDLVDMVVEVKAFRSPSYMQDYLARRFRDIPHSLSEV